MVAGTPQGIGFQPNHEALRRTTERILAEQQAAAQMRDVYKKRLADTSAFVKRLETAYKKVFEVNGSLRAQVSGDKDIITNLKSVTTDHDKSLTSLQSTLMHLSSQLAQANSLRQELVQEQRHAVEQVKKLTEERDTIKMEIRTLSQTLQQTQTARAVLEGELHKVQQHTNSEKSEYEKKISNLDSNLNDTKVRLGAAEDALTAVTSQATAEKSALRGELEILHDAVCRLEEKLKEKSNKIEELDAKIERTVLELDGSRTSVEESTEKIKAMTTELEALKEKETAMNEENSTLNATIAHFKNENEVLCAKISQLEVSLTNEGNLRQSMAAEKGRLEASAEKNRENYAEAMAEKEKKHKGKVDDMQKEVVRLTERLLLTERVVAENEHKLDSRNETIKQLESQYQSMEKAYNDVFHQLEEKNVENSRIQVVLKEKHLELEKRKKELQDIRNRLNGVRLLASDDGNDRGGGCVGGGGEGEKAVSSSMKRPLPATSSDGQGPAPRAQRRRPLNSSPHPTMPARALKLDSADGAGQQQQHADDAMNDNALDARWGDDVAGDECGVFENLIEQAQPGEYVDGEDDEDDEEERDGIIAGNGGVHGAGAGAIEAVIVHPTHGGAATLSKHIIAEALDTDSDEDDEEAYGQQDAAQPPPRTFHRKRAMRSRIGSMRPASTLNNEHVQTVYKGGPTRGGAGGVKRGAANHVTRSKNLSNSAPMLFSLFGGLAKGSPGET